MPTARKQGRSCASALILVEPDVQRQDFLEMVLDGQYGVEGRQRVLRDHADLATPDPAHPFARQAD